jgi:1-hydroxycarotenoid 3,4-desaturase
MRWVFDEIFDAAGETLDDFVALRPAEILARHAWDDTGRLDLFADVGRSADAIGAFAGQAEAAGYRAFCAEARRIYKTLRDTFLTVEKGGPLDLARNIGFGRLGALMGIRPFETLWQALGAHFHDPRLRQLFGRYATYCGSSPFRAPATLMLIAHVEQSGVWLVEGGMQRLADALVTLASGLGVRFRYRAHADEIRLASGRVCGVTLSGGEALQADAVVVNAGAAALASGGLGAGVARAAGARRLPGRSLSAVTWALKAGGRGFPLTRHNVFFSNDYAAEFDDIFNRGQLPRAPTIYVCAQDRVDDEPAASGAERMLILVNAPPCGDEHVFDEEELAACETRVFDHLGRCGLELTRGGRSPVITTPNQFHTMFPATGGALYGSATHGWTAAFDRPGAATRTPGLYLAGGGAHPGAGVPMAALSGRLAARRLMADRASTRRFHPAAMSGGTSTR